MGNPVKINGENIQKTATVGLGYLSADYYMYIHTVTVVLSENSTIGNNTILVSDSTGVVVGEAITFYEGTRIFQNIVTDITGNIITFASAIDFVFTENALIEVGKWNLSQNGSVDSKLAYFKAPKKGTFSVNTISVSMLSSSAMDDGKFGSITQLTKGFIWRYVNGIIKHLALITNNLGFWELGFDLKYSDKAPAGQYGMRARRDVIKTNGTSIYLKNDAEFQVINQDDLTDLDTFAITLNGYIYE